MGHDALSDGLEPISLARVEESLTRQGYAFLEDASTPDHVRARFDDYRFTFLLAGHDHAVLQSRGKWSRLVDVEHKLEMIRMCNEWNMRRIWPKVYVRREGEGMLAVYGEVAADFGAGAADAQIDRALRCGLSSVIAFFHGLEERLGAELADLDAVDA